MSGRTCSRFGTSRKGGCKLNEQARETFASSWGTVLVTAGVAIGLGNIWRFPYMMGNFGGASFLIVYLLVVVLLGIPALMCELALGRYTRRGPMGAFQRAGLTGGRWWGGLLLLTVIISASYYTVIIGWVLYYSVLFLAGVPELPSQQVFESLMLNLPAQSLSVVGSAGLACLALYLGVKKGIEQVSKWITPLFFLLFLVLIARILTLEGAVDQLFEFLRPDWEDMTAGTVLGAMGQGLFSLSLGGTFMLIYGSYLRPQEDVPKSALLTAVMDVGAAMLASLIIVPAVLVFGIDLKSGPPLMFVVMPEIFERIPFGGLFGLTFFVSVFLVALLSLIAAYEVIVGALRDALQWTRLRSLSCILLSQIILGIPAMLSNDYIFYSDMVWGSTMQPVGAVICLIALTVSLGRSRALEELRRNSSIPIPHFLYLWMRYVIPVAIITGLVYGWYGFLRDLSG